MKPSRNHRAARRYAEMGMHVFGLAPDTKVPTSGSHGELDGTSDASAIDATWIARPDLLPAVALRFTPYWVLDVDGRHDGDGWLRALGDLPHTVTAISGSGWPSTHFYFNRTPELEGVRIRALTPPTGFRAGIDVKGLRAGYVVLPPSVHPSGRRYEWEISSRFGEVPIADPPAWLVRKIKAGSTRFTSFQHTTSIAPESFYLGVLFKNAGWLGRELKPGVFAVKCPNENAHSQGRAMAGSTVIFAPKNPGGRGTFFCSHTSGCSEVFR
jgi:hypothetical protein